MGPRALVLAVIGATALATAPARAEPKSKQPLDPSWYVDPAYNPDAHGGLPYATYLRLTRGRFRRSTGMMVTGIVLVGAGSTAMAVGTGVYAAARACGADVPPVASRGFDGGFSDPSCASRQGQMSGMAILIAGTIATGLGIPLWIAGASEVPWAESAKDDRTPASARLVPLITPAAAGHGVALTWQF